MLCYVMLYRFIELKKAFSFSEFFPRSHAQGHSKKILNILKELNQYRLIYLKEKLLQNGPLNTVPMGSETRKW